jgi:hypothetical protein
LLIIFCCPLALLKKKGDVKGASKNSTPVNEEVPPLLEGGGKLEVLLILHRTFFYNHSPKPESAIRTLCTYRFGLLMAVLRLLFRRRILENFTVEIVILSCIHIILVKREKNSI